MANDSAPFYFVLLGFPGLQEKFYPLLAVFTFCLYNVSMCANVIVLAVVSLEEHLHQPMYIIIANLALSDFLFDTTTLPKVISKYCFGAESISFAACFLQMTIVHALNVVDTLTILLMAFDRYVAICRPLRYHAIISNRDAIVLCLAVWLISTSIGIYVMTWALFLPYCGPNRVRTFYCSLSPVAALSCMDSTAVRMNGLYIGVVMHMGSLFFIILSYIVIILNICSQTRLETWKKAFNTCVTHWFVIFIFYVPRMVDYTYQSQVITDAAVTTGMIFVYTYVPHISSPIIFCLRNKEITRTLENVCKKMVRG